jgi:hypothetical protein
VPREVPDVEQDGIRIQLVEMLDHTQGVSDVFEGESQGLEVVAECGRVLAAGRHEDHFHPD